MTRRVGRPELGDVGMAHVRAVDLLDQLEAVTTPTLVVVGSEDAVTPVTAAGEIVGSLPNARLEVIAGAGHFLWLDRPEQLRAVLSDFLAGLVARPVAGEVPGEGG
jgi:pimeloyl-ACP methyl ester carboxylesterase